MHRIALAALALAAGAAVPPAGPAQPSPTCSAAGAKTRVARLVRAFDSSDVDAFAAGFARRGRWHPYTRSIASPGAVGRDEIRQLAIFRRAQGDRWTLTAFARLRADAFRVRVRITTNGEAAGSGATTLVLDCRSGLVRSWIGPNVVMVTADDDD